MHKALGDRVDVWTTLNIDLPDPLDPTDPSDIDAARTLGVNYHGQAVSSRPAPAPFGGEAPVGRPRSSPFPAADSVFSHPRHLPATGMGLEVQPGGLTRVMVQLHVECTAMLEWLWSSQRTVPPTRTPRTRTSS